MPKKKKSQAKGSGLRRSHRIKQKPPAAPKANQEKGKASKTLSPHRIEQELVKMADINEKFLRSDELNKFKMIRQNCYRCARQVSQKNAEMQCDCVPAGGRKAKGNQCCGSGCINRMLMIECGPLCNNGERCTNKRFQHQKGWPCRVFRTEKKGCGIAAEFQIPKGEFIMEYVGEVIDREEFEERLYATESQINSYFMALSGEAIIDATSKGNISRFINHSCDPNAETQKWVVNGELRIGFFSLETIQAGEEITFDYQYERHGKAAQRCYCEATNCRGWLGREPDSDDEKEVEEVEESDKDTELDEDDAKQELEKSPEITKVRTKKTTNCKGQANRKARSLLKPSAVGGSESGEKASKPSKDKKIHVILEDPDVLEELSQLNRSGLKNQQDTLRFSRCMVRAKLSQTRLELLDVLTHGDLPCRRLFLDYNGLRLLHAWISESGQDKLMRAALVDALESLPIPYRSMLDDSGVLQSIRLWSRSRKQTQADPGKRTVALLEKWEAMPEVFRIPKREDTEQVKEHEGEAEHQREQESTSVRSRQERFRRNKARNDNRRRSARRPSAEPRPALCKELRRSLFERKVARDEAEKRVSSEDWREHELRCEFFGAELNTDPKLLPFYQDTDTGEWFNNEDMPVPTPQWTEMLAQALVSPDEVDESTLECQLPAGVDPLPPAWTWQMTPEGDIYYYHLRDRIPQWEPPSPEQRLQKLVDEADLMQQPLHELQKDPNELIQVDPDFVGSLSAQSLAQYVESKVQERRQLRHNRLVSTCVISPRRDEDKENRENNRRRKEICRRRNLDAIPTDNPYSLIEKATNASPAQPLVNGILAKLDALNLAPSTSQAALSPMPSMDSGKALEKFLYDISGVVGQILLPYCQESCKVGRICSDDDYNFLIKRLSHHITDKEMRYCVESGQTLSCSESVRHKSSEFIHQYMSKKGGIYRKPAEPEPALISAEHKANPLRI